MFDSDIQQEQLARLASTQLLLRNVMKRKPRIRMTRPVIFRHSNRLFKRFQGDAVLAEMIIKSFVRRLPLIRTWLIFTVISAVAVLLSPTVLKPFLLIVLALLLSSWVVSHWRSMLAEPYFAQFKWSDHALRESSGHVRFWLVVPSVFFMSLITGLQNYGVWGVLAVVPSVFIWIGLSKFLSTMVLLKARPKGE